MANTDSRIRWTKGGHWMMVFLSRYGTHAGFALPNDLEIIQLTGGGKVQEQQESEEATPEILRELIGYELISDDTDDSGGEDYLLSEEKSDVDN